MAKTQGKCIFCGGTGLSKEHVWSKWTHPYIGGLPKRDHYRAVIRSSRGTPKTRRTQSTKDYTDSVSKIRLRVVCERRCNNGWMGKLDAAAQPLLKPLVTGHPVALGRDNQRIIATWIA